MAYSSIVKPTDYFNTVLYTGNGSTQSVTGFGHAPNLIWTKERNNAKDHAWYDSVRGANQLLESNKTGAESTTSAGISSFDSDGFTTGDFFQTNDNGDSYVSWGWRAGGTASSNSNGSITSSVSANTTAGFSIVSYTGTGSAATVGHGLGAAPEIVIVKRRNNADGWQVYVDGLSSVNHYLRLDTSAAEASDSSRFGAAPTASVFSVGTANGTNASGDTYIAYCFAEKKGYSKFSSYTGNGSTDGTFIYTGFKPAFIIMKSSSHAVNWKVHDNKRDSINDGSGASLSPNEDSAEDDNTAYDIDLLSNGFKQKNNNANMNKNTYVYTYWAFAENPFVANDSGTAVPVVAR